MSSYTWGERSRLVRASLHEDLQKIMDLALSRSLVDFALVEGHRPVEKQQKLFKAGKSKIDGVTKLGKHNYFPSLAVDIVISIEDYPKMGYDWPHLCYVAGIVQSCAQELFSKGEIFHTIRWGGNWDSDGVLLLDQTFDDGPHFELIPLN